VSTISLTGCGTSEALATGPNDEEEEDDDDDKDSFKTIFYGLLINFD